MTAYVSQLNAFFCCGILQAWQPMLHNLMLSFVVELSRHNSHLSQFNALFCQGIIKEWQPIFYWLMLYFVL